MSNALAKTTGYDGAAGNARSEQMKIMPIDIHVGGRIRSRRSDLGIGQIELAGMIGLSPMQLRKLEKGDNRVAVSRLYEISKALETEPGWFFQGFIGGVPTQAGPDINDEMTLHSARVAAAYRSLGMEHRKAIRIIISALAADPSMMEEIDGRG